MRRLLSKYKYPYNSIVCLYNVGENTNIRLLGDAFQIDQLDSMVADGIFIDVDYQYNFNSSGKHTVVYLFNPNSLTSLYGMFSNCSNLIRRRRPSSRDDGGGSGLFSSGGPSVRFLARG